MLQNVLILMLGQLLLPMVRTRYPVFFPCDSDVNSTSIDCSHRSLVEIPVLTSSKVVSLNLSRTKIKEVGSHAFSGIPNLQTLKIMGNCLPGSQRPLYDRSCKMEIHYHAFKGLQKLYYLYLSGNSLRVLPWLPENLRTLDLENNCIFNIHHPLKVPLLQKLLLTKNCFYANPCNQSFYIGENVFRELPKLKYLRLGYNNLTSVPKGLPASLERLDFRENTITEVLDGAFANLTNLKDLNLEWNCQRCDHAARPCFPCPQNKSLSLHPRSFHAEKSSIFFLSLRGNSLRDFPEGLFRPLTKLGRLDLSDNLLAYAIRNGTFFRELRGLTWLSLAYNYEPMRTFNELILSPHLGKLPRLRYLLLSGNFFHVLSAQSLEVLSRLSKLEVLELRMNFINSSNMRALGRLPSLKKVDLSQNMLNFFQSCSGPSSESPLQHGPWQDLSSFHDFPHPSPTLVDPRAAGSQPRQPAEGDMRGVTEDSVLQIPTMEDFRDSFCRRNLTYDLSQNDILYLTRGIFVGMERAVCLDLSYNYMSQTLKGGIFGNVRSLVYLNMAYNRIDLYYREAFAELSATLKVLDLSNNEFHFQMKGMGHRFEFIRNLSRLEVLSLANNDIGMRIDQRLASTSLRHLYFSGNRLDIMWDSRGNIYLHFFQDLVNLIHLDISRNHLRSISPVVLRNLPRSVEALRISSNKLSYFPWQNISALVKLRHLNLSENHLSYMPDAVVDFGPDFTVLDLSYNQIKSLPEDFFNKAESLLYLYLSHNSLKEINHLSLPGPLKNGSALRRLTLHANPFECDCDNTEFAEFLQSTTLQIPFLTTSVHCEFPESLQGNSVLSIDQRSCQDIYGGVAFLATSFLAAMLIVLPLLRHLYGWDLWYGVQVLWAGHKGYSHRPGGDPRGGCDAFVVFDVENQAVRDWVYNELTVHVESSGHRRFCLCLEERDWVPGLSCIENLHNSVYDSVKTVFVLSSGWSSHGDVVVNGVMRQAFFMVQQRLLDEKVDVAVLVLLDEIFPKLKYLQLRKRLCRKSVLSWPKNPKAQPLFWNRMRVALASDNLRLYDNNMTESFM